MGICNCLEMCLYNHNINKICLWSTDAPNKTLMTTKWLWYKKTGLVTKNTWGKYESPSIIRSKVMPRSKRPYKSILFILQNINNWRTTLRAFCFNSENFRVEKISDLVPSGGFGGGYPSMTSSCKWDQQRSDRTENKTKYQPAS